MLQGFPPHHLLSWLEKLPTSFPVVDKMSSFWILKAEVAMKQNEDNVEAALSILDQATTENVEVNNQLLIFSTYFLVKFWSCGELAAV